jgi:hypothetical protein
MQLGTPPQRMTRRTPWPTSMTCPAIPPAASRTEALEQPFTCRPAPGWQQGDVEYSQKYATKDYADFAAGHVHGSGIIMSTSSKPILTVEGLA